MAHSKKNSQRALPKMRSEVDIDWVDAASEPLEWLLYLRRHHTVDLRQAIKFLELLSKVGLPLTVSRRVADASAELRREKPDPNVFKKLDVREHATLRKVFSYLEKRVAWNASAWAYFFEVADAINHALLVQFKLEIVIRNLGTAGFAKKFPSDRRTAERLGKALDRLLAILDEPETVAAYKDWEPADGDECSTQPRPMSYAGIVAALTDLRAEVAFHTEIHSEGALNGVEDCGGSAVDRAIGCGLAPAFELIFGRRATLRTTADQQPYGPFLDFAEMYLKLIGEPRERSTIASYRKRLNGKQKPARAFVSLGKNT